jgi:hypothetical protein
MLHQAPTVTMQQTVEATAATATPTAMPMAIAMATAMAITMAITTEAKVLKAAIQKLPQRLNTGNAAT